MWSDTQRQPHLYKEQSPNRQHDSYGKTHSKHASNEGIDSEEHNGLISTTKHMVVVLKQSISQTLKEKLQENTTLKYSIKFLELKVNGNTIPV